MIVRLMGDAQYQIEDSCLQRLNALDDDATKAIEAHDQAALEQHLGAIWALVRQEGTALSDDALTPSDAVVPPFDLSLEEARGLLGDEGFIPDPPT